MRLPGEMKLPKGASHREIGVRGAADAPAGGVERRACWERSLRHVARSAGPGTPCASRFVPMVTRGQEGCKQRNTDVLFMLRKVIPTAMQVKDFERPEWRQESGYDVQ